jgi:hypothetical protein
VQEHVGAGARRDVAGRHHVIEVGVRVDDLDGAQTVARPCASRIAGASSARVDDQRFLGVGAADDRAVAAERADRERLSEQRHGVGSAF